LAQHLAKLEKEINDLKSQAISPTLLAEKQQKVDELIKIIEKQNQAIEKYGDELDDYTDDKS